MSKAEHTAPLCCGVSSRLTDGKEIYPHRSDLFQKQFYKCDSCAAYCGCHPGTTHSLGTPANAELRRARSMLHDQMIDPLWKTAKDKKSARGCVYGYLAKKLGISTEDTHTGMFDLETCRRAWAALNGVSYHEICAWHESATAAKGGA